MANKLRIDDPLACLARGFFKYCPKCEETKILTDFNRDKNRYGGVYFCCKICQRVDSKKRIPNKEVNRRKAIKHKYGLTEEDYNDLLIKQDYTCAICVGDTHRNPQTSKLYVDHCHETNRVRGLLCFSCNSGLGGFKDDLALLYKAVSYLTNPKIFELPEPFIHPGPSKPYKQYPDYTLDRYLFKYYKIRLNQYQYLVEQHNGVCAICDQPPHGTFNTSRLAVDHCHNSNQVRGLLCHKCNAGLGHFQDDITLIQRAIKYLLGSLLYNTVSPYLVKTGH